MTIVVVILKMTLGIVNFSVWDLCRYFVNNKRCTSAKCRKNALLNRTN